MNNIRYLSLDEAKETYFKTIKHSGGGAAGYLNIEQLDSVLCHIQNDEYYPTFIDKITHLFFSACKFHCFQDGNKRIAITLSAEFLLRNGYMAIAPTFFSRMENISYHVASGKIDCDLTKKIMQAIFNNTFDEDESLKLEIYNAIS
ncbi:MAG: Fic family protein [Bacillota bacterium]